METGVIVQAVSVVLAALAIVWHQQRSTDKLRTDLRAEIHEVRTEVHELRAELRAEIREVRTEVHESRTELRAEIHKLQTTVADNSQRLARIEGYLGIGMPSEAAPNAAGASAVPAQSPAASAAR